MNNSQYASLPISLLNISQVASALGLSRGKIYQLIRQENLPVVPFGRTMRVRPESLQRWLEQREDEAIGTIK